MILVIFEIITHNAERYILMATEEDRRKATRAVPLEHKISQSTVVKYLKKN